MLEKKSLWNTEIMGQALLDSVRKLDRAAWSRIR